MPDPHRAGPLLSRRGPVLALALVGLALVLRLPGLLEWWINPDEGIYYSILTRERFGDFWTEAKSTAHPPLYFLILRAVGWLTTDFMWHRSIALVAGCGAVLGFVYVGRELGGSGSRGWATGLLAGLALAVAPRAIVLSQVIRPYMLLLLLLSVCVALLLRQLRAPSMRALAVYAVMSSVAILLHYSSVFALTVMAAIVLVDGLAKGTDRPAWRRLVAAHAVPAVTLASMYVWHLDGFMQSVEAENTLACCLMPFMIQGPGDVWPSIVGFHSTFAGDDYAVPTSLLTLGVAGLAAWKRAWTPLTAITVGLGVGVAGSLTQTYPFGPTRHSAWLLVMLLPALGWGISELLHGGRRGRGLAAAGAVALALGAGPLSQALDPEDRPRDISERVVRRASLGAMAGALDPAEPPRLTLMSNETYLVLIPLYWRERQRFDESADGLLYRFRWGARHVVVLPDRDFTALPHQVGRPNHLVTALRTAERDFGIEVAGSGEPVMVLAAGYESRGMADMVQLAQRTGSLGNATSVPGVIALYLDAQAYRSVVSDGGA